MIALSLLRCIEIALLAAGWTSIGHGLLSHGIRRDPNRAAVWATSLALGAGTATVVLTGLAMLGLHGRAWCWAVALCSLVPLGRAAQVMASRERSAAPLWRVHDRWELAGLSLIAGLLLLTLFVTLAPPSSMDATVYHLRAPHEIMRAGFWARMDEPHAYQPLYVEMLFGEALAIGGGPLAALVHWTLGVGAAVVAAAWAKRFGGRSIWAIVIFVGTGLYVWETTSSFIDLGLALFSGLALFWSMRPDVPGSTVLAGLFGGLTAGTKFTGVVAGALVGLAAAAMVWPDRRRAFHRLLTVGALTILVALPWYVRDLVLTGNPIYPLLNRAFGLPPVTLSLLPYGLGRDVFHLMSSPFDLLTRGATVFDQGWSVGPAYLGFVPLAIVIRPTRVVLTAAGVLVAWWIIWFFASPQTRLLLPIMPMAAGLASVAATAAFKSRLSVRLAAAAVLGLAMAGAFATAGLSGKETAHVVLGLETTQQYLRRTSWNFVAYDVANQTLPSDARVAVAGAGNLYYLDREAHPVGLEALPASELTAKRFTHELWIGSCPAGESRDRIVLAAGEYPLRASRLGGGVFAIQCYRLASLPSDARPQQR